MNKPEQVSAIPDDTVESNLADDVWKLILSEMADS